MAGKDDIKLLASFVYSKLKGAKFDKSEVEPVAAVVMNRAVQIGSLPEAIQSMSPTPDIMDVIQGNLKGRELKEYKRAIQLSSKFLRGANDPTGGATEFAPKRSKIDKTGLIKTHATKNHNYYIPNGMQNVPQVTL